MENFSATSPIARAFATIALIALGTALVVALICWLIGFHALDKFGYGMVIAGMAWILIGVRAFYSALNWNARAATQLADTTPELSLDESRALIAAERQRHYAFGIVWGLAGAVVMLIGMIVPRWFGG
ncbi:MAG: hypothetical protein HZC40_01685 [Chloroflexi bacterium]|nr:hypothetical protein [Chloroflexota bacterium]